MKAILASAAALALFAGTAYAQDQTGGTSSPPAATTPTKHHHHSASSRSADGKQVPAEVAETEKLNEQALVNAGGTPK